MKAGTSGGRIATAAATAVLFLVVLLLAAVTTVSGSPQAGAAGCSSAAGPSGTTTGASLGPVALSGEQVGNARLIWQVAHQAGLPEPAAVVALATAYQESKLANLPPGAGDLDSVGLFQQRPSQGWGAPEQLGDPAYATAKFLAALLAVPNWEALPVGVAAQDVQRSAGSAATYQQWSLLAGSLAASFTAGTAVVPGEALPSAAPSAVDVSCPGSDGLGPVGTGPAGPLPVGIGPPAGWSLPAGTPPQAAGAVTFALAQLGKPYVWGASGPSSFDCSGLVMAAYASVGVGMPRTTYEQVSAGVPIYASAHALPGDLLFFTGSDPGPGGAPGHVGIYLGDGLMVHAPQTGDVVRVASVDWPAVVAIRRLSA